MCSRDIVNAKMHQDRRTAWTSSTRMSRAGTPAATTCARSPAELPRGRGRAADERGPGDVPPRLAHIRGSPALGVAVERDLELDAAWVIDEELPEARPRHMELAPVEPCFAEPRAKLVKAVCADRDVIDGA